MIVDANIGFKWIVQEADSDRALVLLSRSDLHAPDLMIVENGYALGKQLRRGLIGRAQARALWDQLLSYGVRLQPSMNYMSDAFEFSLRLHASMFDCVYLAMAVAEDDQMITADARFAAAVRKEAGLAPRVLVLGEA